MMGAGGGNSRNMTAEERQARFGEMRQKMEKLTKEITDETMSILTPQQKEKLEKMQGKKFEFEAFAGGRRGGQPAANTEKKSEK